MLTEQSCGAAMKDLRHRNGSRRRGERARREEGAALLRRDPTWRSLFCESYHVSVNPRGWGAFSRCKPCRCVWYILEPFELDVRLVQPTKCQRPPTVAVRSVARSSAVVIQALQRPNISIDCSSAHAGGLRRRRTRRLSSPRHVLIRRGVPEQIERARPCARRAAEPGDENDGVVGLASSGFQLEMPASTKRP